MNCARCGATNDPSLNFCINCGNALQQQPPPPPSFDRPPPAYGKPAPPPYGWQQPSSPLGQPSGQPPQPGYGQPPQAYGHMPPGYTPPAGNQQLFGAYTQDVPNYLVPAILSTIFCCVPVGIVAIIYAVQVNNKKMVGDLAGAAEASGKAQTWVWVSFGLGLIVVLLNVIVAIAGA